MRVFRRELPEKGCFRRLILTAIYSIVQSGAGERPGADSGYAGAVIFQE